MGMSQIAAKLTKRHVMKKGAKLSKKAPAAAIPDGAFDYLAQAKADYFTVGFDKTDVMPSDIPQKKYYVAGYSAYNPAKSVLDPMTTSAIWIDDNSGRGGVVFVSFDSVGLTSYDVNLARRNLADFCKRTGCRSINVMSTHNHAGIDTVGMWGPLPRSGRNPKYMDIVHKGIVRVVEGAYANRKDGDLYYGKKETPEIQRDSRLPHVFCKDLTRLRFVPRDGSQEVWMLNYASHTENMLGDDIVSADFACYMRRDILEMAGAESIYFVGAIGGLIRLKELDKDHIESTKIGGRALAETAVAIEDERKLSPVVNMLRQPYYSPLGNYLLATLASLKILKSDAWCGTGGEGLQMSVLTEMSYFEIGDLHMLLLPCELFPELAYGGYLKAEECATGKDPDEVNPKPLIEIAKDPNLLIFGVSNDFTGYVVPPNDFLLHETAAYVERAKDHMGRGHYEETNSLGPLTAPTIAAVFGSIMERVEQAKQK